MPTSEGLNIINKFLAYCPKFSHSVAQPFPFYGFMCMPSRVVSCLLSVSGRAVRLLRHCLLALLLLGSLLLGAPAKAAEKYAAIVVDAKSGKVVTGANAEAYRHPASLTKIMTLYLTFKALREGRVRLNQNLTVSSYAAAQSPSKLGVEAGTTLRVRDAILGLVTESANDAAVVLAEALGGSESGFARQMTAQARQLGMSRTLYRNASGLPDDEQVTTARDQAILARAILYHFPEYYGYFKTPSFTYLGRVHDNHNRLMRRYNGMDGIKTGYIRASGFNLVASAVRGNTRLIAVIFGGNSARERDNDMAALLDAAFNRVGAGWAAATAPVAAETANAEGDEQDMAEPKPANAAPAPSADAAPVAAASPPPQVITTPAPVVPSIAAAPPKPRVVAAARPATPPARPVAAAPRPRSDPTGVARAPAAKALWLAQIGVYEHRQSAHTAIQKAARALPKSLTTVRYQIVALKTKRSTTYRAQLIGLNETTARSVCRIVGGNSCRIGKQS
jgi:D-alanyl-D-alanine carboxypeptidase